MTGRAIELEEILRITESLIRVLETGSPDQLDELLEERGQAVARLTAITPPLNAEERTALAPKVERLRLLEALLESRAKELRSKATEALEQIRVFQGRWGKSLATAGYPNARRIDHTA
ncbi:MAG: hypothetical protein RL885_08770 [Planctomycetota bacterium]